MRGKWLALAAALLLAPTAGASELTDAASALPPMFTLRELAGTQTLYFGGRAIPYTAAQLSADMRRDDMYLSGYLFSAAVPEDARAVVAPYFAYNLSKTQLEGLSEINRALFDEEAPLHEAIEESIRRWADAMVGGNGAGLGVSISSVEPARRTEGVNSILYTAGAEITLSSEGLILPLYGRGYLYKDGADYRFVLLVTGDDSKQPMSYALEDMVKEAARRAAKRDIEAFVRERRSAVSS